MEMMKCPECGEETATDSNFCGKCGKNIGAEESEEHSWNVAMIIGAVIGAIIGISKMGPIGLIMALPGMVLGGLIPGYLTPGSRKRKES